MFATIDARSLDEIAALLGVLPASHQAQLVRPLERGRAPARHGRRRADLSFLLRPHQPGHIVGIVHRHGSSMRGIWPGYDFRGVGRADRRGLYREFRCRRERCWIAERDAKSSARYSSSGTAKKLALRLLLVEPKGSRGSGLDAGSSGSVSAIARRAGIASSHCGQTTCWSRRAGFTKSVGFT